VNYTGNEGPREDRTLGGARDAAIDLMRQRKQCGALESEADFIAGLVAVTDYVFGDGETSTITPRWFVDVLRGDSVLDPLPRQKAEVEDV